MSRQLTAEEAKLRRVRVMVKPGTASKDDVRPGDVGAIDEEGSSVPWVKFDGKSSRPFRLRVYTGVYGAVFCSGISATTRMKKKEVSYIYRDLVWWGLVQRLDLVAPFGARKGMRVIALPGIPRAGVAPGDIGTVDESDSTIPDVMWDAKPGVAKRRIYVLLKAGSAQTPPRPSYAVFTWRRATG